MLTENKIFIEDVDYITETMSKNMENKTVLITGACGMIGTMLSYALIKSGAIVYGIDISEERAEQRFGKYIREKKFIFMKADITEKLELNFKIDYIIHAASNAYPKAFETDPVGTMLQNFFGIKYLLDYAVKAKARLIYISTGEVYGQYNGEDFNEDCYGYMDILNPRSCYPSSKRAAETLLASYVKQYNAEAVVARLSYVYGLTATNLDTRASTSFIRNGVEGENIIMKSKGEQVRSYTYIADCAAAIIHILINGKTGEAYNVAFDNSIISICEMAKIIAELCKTKVIFELPKDEEKASFNPVTRSVLKGDKLKKLGFCGKYSIKDGLARTIDALRN